MVVNGLGLPGDTSSQARTYWHILPSLWMRRPTSQSHSTASLTGNVKPCTRRDRLGGGGGGADVLAGLLNEAEFPFVERDAALAVIVDAADLDLSPPHHAAAPGSVVVVVVRAPEAATPHTHHLQPDPVRVARVQKYDRPPWRPHTRATGPVRVRPGPGARHLTGPARPPGTWCGKMRGTATGRDGGAHRLTMCAPT